MSRTTTALIMGERVRLVPGDDSMAEQFQSWLGDTDTRHLIGGAAYPISMEAEREFLRGRQQVGWDSGFFMAIEAIDVPEPVLIGSVELRHVHPEARWCDVGILIGDPAHRGGGYGTEAMRLACRFAFEEMGMERVELETFDFNTRAVRSYEKVGFVVEGTKRRGAYLGGRFYDVIVMGLLREEFRDGARDG